MVSKNDIAVVLSKYLQDLFDLPTEKLDPQCALVGRSRSGQHRRSRPRCEAAGIYWPQDFAVGVQER